MVFRGLYKKFSYDPMTGILCRSGKPVGNRRKDGYLQIESGGKKYLVHRFIWFLRTGAWPVDQLDHKNLVHDDNRWRNLREATRSQNMQNTLRRNTIKGIYKCGKKWGARLSINGKDKHLGVFETAALAKEFRDLAAQMVHGEFFRS